MLCLAVHRVFSPLTLGPVISPGTLLGTLTISHARAAGGWPWVDEANVGPKDREETWFFGSPVHGDAESIGSRFELSIVVRTLGNHPRGQIHRSTNRKVAGLRPPVTQRLPTGFFERGVRRRFTVHPTQVTSARQYLPDGRETSATKDRTSPRTRQFTTAPSSDLWRDCQRS